MRKFAQILPQFWTRGSGKKLRGNRDAQVLAMYLMTGPSSNKTGLYYQPVVSILHDIGGMSEKEFRTALASIAEIARYDFEEELVWLPNGCRVQMGLLEGGKIKPTDKALKSVLTEIEPFGSHPFALEFRARYLPDQYAPSMGDSMPHQESKDGAPGSAGCPPSPVPVLSLSLGEGKPGSVTCPGPTEALNADQRKTLQMTIPDWAIDLMLSSWCAERQARGESRTLRAWRTFCAKDLIAQWQNPGRRPQKPRATLTEEQREAIRERQRTACRAKPPLDRAQPPGDGNSARGPATGQQLISHLARQLEVK